MDPKQYLKTINWEKFSHAYGNAKDLPELLLKLYSKNEDEFSEAYEDIFQTVWHQGTVYSVTEYVVHFFAYLLQEGEVSYMDGILYGLQTLGNGNSYFDVHYDLDPEWSEKSFNEKGTNKEDVLREELGYVQRSRNAVLKHSNIYLSLLNHKNPRVVGHSIYLLSDLFELGPNLLEALINGFVKNNVLFVKNSYLNGIREFNLGSNDQKQKTSFFKQVFDPLSSPYLNSSAALGLLEIQKEETPRDVVLFLLNHFKSMNHRFRNVIGDDDFEYIDPWGPGVSKYQIRRTIIKISSRDNLELFKLLLDILTPSSEAYDFIKDFLFEKYKEDIPLNLSGLSSMRNEIVKDTYHLNINRQQFPLKQKINPDFEKYRQIALVIIDCDSFWIAESNLLEVFGLPNSKEKFLELFQFT